MLYKRPNDLPGSVAVFALFCYFSVVFYSLLPGPALLSVMQVVEAAFWVPGAMAVRCLDPTTGYYFILAFVVSNALLSSLIYSLHFSMELLAILSSFNDTLLFNCFIFQPLNGGFSFEFVAIFSVSEVQFFTAPTASLLSLLFAINYS